jgi:FtsH-binding integral membrane protein
MSPSNSNSSVFDRLSATTVLTESQAAVIKQTYALFGIAVISAMVGGYIGATTEMIVRFFSSWVGWIAAMIGLNVVPWIAMSARGNSALGTAALVSRRVLRGALSRSHLVVRVDQSAGDDCRGTGDHGHRFRGDHRLCVFLGADL